MAELKNEFERLGYEDVSTYLNSGNVIFKSSINDKVTISECIHKMVEDKFGISVPIYIIKPSELEELLANQPSWWGTDNKKIYDNIIFIISPYTYEDVYKTIADTAKEYTKEIFENLREYEYNPMAMKLYIVGGGGCLIRNFAHYDKSRVTINGDIHATAKGYEYLAELGLKRGVNNG